MSKRELYRQRFGKPNFVVIHTDQQRADCVNAYGRRKGIYTPYQDSIAAQGVRFDSCYSACPVCIPQRLSLLTGQSPQKHGVYGNVGIPDLELETTFPEEMKKGGYQTALIGRTMHTYPFSNPYGFQTYVPGDPSNNEKDKDAFFRFIKENGPAGNGGYYACGPYNNSRAAAPFHMDNRFHQTMWATNQAIDYIGERRKDRQPFMLFLGYYAPHSPHNPPREWMEHYLSMELKDEPVIADYDIEPVSNGNPISPYVKLEEEDLRMVRAGYYGNISFLDMQVGRILNELTTLPNTYVIFTSDHGEMLGDHYRMHKSTPYQGAVHIPLMIYGPGIRGNRVNTTPIAWQDIMPTVLELAELPVPDSVDGISFAGTLLEETDKKEREYLHGESEIGKNHSDAGYERQEHEGNLAFENGAHYLTDGKMKYIWYNMSGREQLFDLVHDYDERYDLSKNPEYQEELLMWRGRLVKELEGRPEGFSDGIHLLCAKEESLSPKMQEVCDKRLQEGKTIAYYIPKEMKPR